MSREFYEKEYHYDEDIEFLDFRRIHYFFKKVRLQPKLMYLDIGSGVGGALTYCNAVGMKCVGFDISDRAIRLSQSILPPTIRTLVANGEHLPFRDGSFDVISSLGVIEHFSDPEQGAREIHRVLKENGQALLVVPNSYGILHRLKIYTGTEQPQELLATYYQWGHLLYKCGLQTMTVSSDLGPPVFKNTKILGIVKRLLLKFTLLLPTQYAYQFVFVCRKR
ncbi:class I SAM-dependent methyltransferase [candidate division WOR-3 bacterium]|nr:class I SAM-dependent methyltransferase [candidate division WOR-3 bacterium]